MPEFNAEMKTPNVSILSGGQAVAKQTDSWERIVKLTAIKVPVGRARKEFKNIAALAESIKFAGLIQAPLVRETAPDTYELVAGERRFRACCMLGWTEIPVRIHPETDPLLCKIIESEENLQRENIGWVEQSMLYEDIDRLRREKFGSGGAGNRDAKAWTTDKTAALVEENATVVAKKIRAAKILKERPELREAISALPMAAGLRQLDKILTTEKLHQQAGRGELTFSTSLQNIDCLEGIKLLADNSIGCVITDPPFGMAELQESVGKTFGESATYTAFLKPTDNQTIEQVRALLSALAPELFRVMQPGSHLYMFCSFEIYHAFLLDLLRKQGFEIGHQPLIWDKGRPTTQFTGYDFPSCYEPIIFGHKPPRRQLTNTKLQNILRYPPLPSARKLHPFQKPVELIRDLIETSTQPGETILDPFAGSGVAVSASRLCKRSCVAFELDKDNYVRAQAMLAMGEISELTKAGAA